MGNSLFKKMLQNIDEIIGSVFLGMVVVLTCVNVIMRYCFNTIFVQAEELILISFIWSTYIGVTSSYKKDNHIVIDVVYTYLPPLGKKLLDIVVHLLEVMICVYMTYLSINLCMTIGGKTTYVTRLSYVYIDSALVLSFGLMSIYAVMKLFHEIKTFNDYKKMKEIKAE